MKYQQITATLKHIHVLPHTYHTQTNTHTHSDHNKQRHNLKNVTKKVAATGHIEKVHRLDRTGKNHSIIKHQVKL